MKYIKLLLFFLLPIFLEAQTVIDTTIKFIPINSTGELFTIPSSQAIGKWSKADSIIRIDIGGKIYIRQNTGGVWNIEACGVNKNNTAAKNAYWLQKAVDRPYIKEIIVTSDSANTVFQIASNVNLRGKTLTFKNGCTIDGSVSVTIDSAVVRGELTSQMFGININLTNVKSADKYFSVNWLGLKAEGTSGPNNSRAVIRKFKDLHKLNLIFPDPAGYLVDTTFFIHRDNNLDQSNSQLIVNNNWRGVGLQIGDSLLTYRPYGGVWNVRVGNSVFAPTFTTADSNHIGVLIVNAEEVEDVNIVYVNGFYNAFVLRGHNNGCVGNKIKVTKTNNSINHIVLENRGGGWTNGNILSVGHARNQTGFNLSLRATAITIGNPNYQWVCQGNRVIGGTYELNNTSLGRLCYIRFGMSNELRLDYLEANGSTAMYVGTNVQNINNHVYLGHTSGASTELKSDSSVLAGSTTTSARSLGLRDNFSPVYDVKDLSTYTAAINANGDIAVGGGLNSTLMSVYGGVLDSLGTATWDNGYIYMPAGTYYAIGTGQINTEKCKEFIIRANYAPGYEGKVFIKQINAAGNVITNANEVSKVKATFTPYWNSAYFGGSYEIGTIPGNYGGDMRVVVADSCVRMQVFFKAPMSGGGSKIRGFYIGAADYGHVPVYTNVGSAIRVRQKPTVGNYEAGMELVDINPANKRAWKVVRSGTLRKNALSANITYTNNSVFATLSVSNDSVQIGNWIQIGANNPYRIIGKTGTNGLIFDNVIWGSGTNAIVFATPQFIEVTEGGGVAGVSSFNGRTGAVVPATGDYTFSQIGSKPTTLSGYGITDAVPSSRTITINGTTYDLSANRSWTISTLSNPMTTAGDIIVAGSGGTPNRLAKGSDGQVIKMISGNVAWGTDNSSANGSSGDFTPSVSLGTNASSYSINEALYQSLDGSVVNADYNVLITSAASGLTAFSIDPPPFTLGSGRRIIGSAHVTTNGDWVEGSVINTLSSGKIQVMFIAQSATVNAVILHISYRTY